MSRFQLVIVYVLGLSHCVRGLANPVAFYPFDDDHKVSDISCHSNGEGYVVGAKLTTGPNGIPNTAYDFAATKRTNFIELPGTSYTDTKYSMTVLLWIYHSGFSGPVVDYATDGFGVNLWMTGKDTLYGRIISRDGNTHQFLSSNQIGLQYSWHYVGMGYDYSTGIAVLWVDGISVQQAYVGSIELKTAGLLRLGALTSDDRIFRGKLSCLQIYDKPLKASEIAIAKRRCKKQTLDCSKKGTPECGGTMSTLSGTITSPQFPREYPPNTQCVWKLNVPKGKRIIIRFRNIDLENESYGCGDYIEVFDGFNTWSTRLIKYCKSQSAKQLQFASKSNKMRIEFTSNSEHHGKGFTASYISEDKVQATSKASDLDLSVHYTGIVIGVACAALLAALTIIAINHNKQSRRRRSSTLSSRPRRSDSFSAIDIIAQGAPPSYDIVMRCPDLYPPSPQMTPAASLASSSSPGRILRCGALQRRPLYTADPSRFIRECHSSSDDSETDDPPPYPGIGITHPDLIELQQSSQLVNDSEQTNSQSVARSQDTHHQLSVHPDSTCTFHLSANEPCSHTLASNQEDIEHLTELESLEGETHPDDNPLESSDVTDNSDQELFLCKCTVLEHHQNGRSRLDTQSSIVGTVV